MVGRRALVIGLVVLLIASGCIGGPAPNSDVRERQLLERVNALEEENAGLREMLEQENLSIRSYENQLAFYRSQLGEAVCTLPGLNGTSLSGSASLDAPAVMQRRVYERDGPFISERIEQEGTLINISVEIGPGRGRVLVHTTPLMGEVFQDAANTAVFVAQARTGRDLSRSDVIVSIVADEEVPAVNGGSAGALMTLLMISAIEGSPVRSDVTLTGTIDQTGRIGAIGGVLEKAEAAKKKGKTLFMLPRENSQLIR
ncbi:MAG TPA: hypothetical protein PK089_09605, partial [Methanoregulaceae archaeon]|nr:hypothetical protein [Methanoregulaceae archaeon]